MENKTVVLVAADNRHERRRLGALLECGGYRVIPAADGREALSTASSHCPELVLLGLPPRDTAAVLSSLRTWSAVPLIVLSDCADDEAVVSALDGGADDVLQAPFADAVLMARIRAALRRSTTVKPHSRFEHRGLSLDFERREVRKDGVQIHLTPIEYKMLALLAQNAGKAVTYQALRREIWGPYVGDNRLLRVNMANLRRKIEQNPAIPEFLHTELGFGYRMTDAENNLKQKES